LTSATEKAGKTRDSEIFAAERRAFLLQTPRSSDPEWLNASGVMSVYNVVAAGFDVLSHITIP